MMAYFLWSIRASQRLLHSTGLNNQLGWRPKVQVGACAYAEVFHLLALTLFLGTVLVLTLRLFNLVFREKSVAATAKKLIPWSMAGLFLTLLTGALLFLQDSQMLGKYSLSI